MSIINRAALSTLALGIAFGFSAPASATGYYVTSNAVDKCQAFTPGVTNTMRNRVTGAENVGASPIAVACVFELAEIYGGSSVSVDTVAVFFKNGDAAPVTVNCSLLPGNYNDGIGTLESTSVVIAAGDQSNVMFTGPYAVYGMGINCVLPPHVTITETLIRYQDDHA